MSVKPVLIFLTLTIHTAAFATQVMDSIKRDAPVICTTRGVSAHVKHDGGYQIRLDAKPYRSDMVNGTLYEIRPGEADGISKSQILSQSFLFTMLAGAPGECHLIMSQVDDPFTNKLNLDITVKLEDPENSSAKLSVDIDNAPIKSEHGDMVCSVQSLSLLQTIDQFCPRGFSDKWNFR